MAGALRARYAAGDHHKVTFSATGRRWLPKAAKAMLGNNRERLRKVAAGWEALRPSFKRWQRTCPHYGPSH